MDSIEQALSDETVNYDPTARVLRVTTETGLRDAVNGVTPPAIPGYEWAVDEYRRAILSALAAKDAERPGEYGRLLAERDRLIADGADPADLDVPKEP